MSSCKVKPLSDEETERLKALYPETFCRLGQRYVRTMPGNCVLPIAYVKHKDRFKNWHVRKDDVYVMSFPKTGTTWTQELVWCVQNECNIEKATSILGIERIPFLELQLTLEFSESHSPSPSEELDLIGMIENMPSPRIIKSHMPFCLFPENLLDESKVVVCLRNPKDTVVSYFHHERLFHSHGYAGDFPSYFDLFMDNLLQWSPYFDFVSQAWEKRHHPNLCILFYEDMKLDLAAAIRKVMRFLGKEMALAQLELLIDHLSFSKMQANSAVNRNAFETVEALSKEGKFIRKGEVGDWKNYFSQEMSKRMDEAIEKHFKPIGLEFRYE